MTEAPTLIKMYDDYCEQMKAFNHEDVETPDHLQVENASIIIEGLKLLAEKHPVIPSYHISQR